ncbi:MAG: Translation initiation factor 2 [Candidatus Ozemobacter sibiricus]|uniref:Translation initiation factor 2 n=1 Tax=Candidatus Ozemobacter sibiricus TaxID=2268124 RepID=A0A367ZSZ3_9BACT|nr:MAG: Translation initiation factor 2 [Candidatus Ozemobacter sibiricus]
MPRLAHRFGPPARRGSAIFMALIMGIVFFMVVSSLLHYLSGERRQVKHVIGKKQAELLAISGIDWADQELRQKRWYQPPWGTTVTGGGRPSSGLVELTPFGPGMGKVTVVCEDVPARQPVSNIRNRQQLWLLHHINVFSLGEFGDARCLLYGRFIMSPEPALNDDSTDAVIFADEGTNPDQIVIKLPADSGERLKVTQILCQPGSPVDINQVLIRLTTEGANPRLVEVRPPAHGVVRLVRCRVGDSVPPGATLVVLDKPGSSARRTLKRMVRVTRIDEAPWNSLDITDFHDRRALSEYISLLSEVFLLNHGARPDLQKAALAHRHGGLPPTMTPEEFLKTFPAGVRNTTRDRAENEFMADLLRRFTLTPAKDWPEALKKTALQLDHPRMDVPPELRAILQDLNLLNLRDTAPRRDPRLYRPRLALDEFLDLLKPAFNQDPEAFIKTLSELPDASRWIEVTKDPSLRRQPGSHQETERGIRIVKPESEASISVDKLSKPYDFTDPGSGYQGRAEHVLGFIRKYYSDQGAILPHEPVRNLEFLDWPLPDPPPPPPPPRQGGEWVWVPGEPGVPPGPPTWTYQGGRPIEVRFPSGGERDHEPRGGPPDGGQRTYGIVGLAPSGATRGTTRPGRSPESSSGAGANPAGAPTQGGASRDRDGRAPDSGGAQSQTPGRAPEGGGGQGGGPGRGPGPASSIFSTQRPPVQIPTGGRFVGTAGPAGIPPKQGEYAWVEPCPPGGAPAGGGGQGAWAQGGTAPGRGRQDGSGFGGNTPGGAGRADGRGHDLDGSPAAADGHGRGLDGAAAGADGHGRGLDGSPGAADGHGYAQDGRPGGAAGAATGLDGRPGAGVADGRATSGQPGSAGGQSTTRTGPPSGTSGGAGRPGSPGSSASPGPINTTSPVIKCPICGKLHKNPHYGGAQNAPGGGGGSSTTRGGC